MLTDLDRLVSGLRRPDAYDHPVARVEVIETHISVVLLTGRFAYKLKKPVDLGFVDFTALARRRHFCEEELRLNRRTAPELYEAVVAITGSPDRPRIGGGGPVLDYAVRMRQFPAHAMLDRLAERGELDPERLEALARVVAEFHASLPPVLLDEDDFVRGVRGRMRENFDALAGHVLGCEAELAALGDWTGRELERLDPVLRRRLGSGHVRECHGDLHLANIVLLDQRPTPFDCIEFDPALRAIDVMSDLAFLEMDLAHRAGDARGTFLLDHYLEHGGDYAGLAVHRLYRVYRALVRAKVSVLSPGRAGAAASYVRFARASTEPGGPPVLVLMHGLSGSGKSTVARAAAERIGAIRLRSDVERKRLAGLAAEAESGSGLGSGLYASGMTERTYRRLEDLAAAALAAGWDTIVDASFLDAGQRERFARLAARLGVPWRILSTTARPETLDARVARRTAAGGDASEADAAVLAHQRRHFEPLGGRDAAASIVVATDGEAESRRGLAAVEACVRALSPRRGWPGVGRPAPGG